MPTETTLSSPALTPRTNSMTAETRCASSSIASFAYGAVAGAAAGVALALLFAPMRGAAMRARVRSYAAEGSHKMQELIASGRSMANDALHQTTSTIQEGRRAFRTSGYSSPEPLTASVAEISSAAHRFEEPLGG